MKNELKYEYLNSCYKALSSQFPKEEMYFVTIQPNYKIHQTSELIEYVNSILKNATYVLQIEITQVTIYKTTCYDGLHAHIIIPNCFIKQLNDVVIYKNKDQLNEIKALKGVSSFTAVARKCYSNDWNEYLSKQIESEHKARLIINHLNMSSNKIKRPNKVPNSSICYYLLQHILYGTNSISINSIIENKLEIEIRSLRVLSNSFLTHRIQYRNSNLKAYKSDLIKYQPYLPNAPNKESLSLLILLTPYLKPLLKGLN